MSSEFLRDLENGQAPLSQKPASLTAGKGFADLPKQFWGIS
jgi:hypothetical protein